MANVNIKDEDRGSIEEIDGEKDDRKRDAYDDNLFSITKRPKHITTNLPLNDVMQRDNVLNQLWDDNNNDNSEFNCSTDIASESESISRLANIENTLKIDDILLGILSFCDVVSLVDKKRVCLRWRELCTQAIDRKTNNKPVAFEEREDLEIAVQKYMGRNASEMEELASTYGWPIGRWNVSKVDDFSFIFSAQDNIELKANTFNEDISAWDVSSAEDMSGMFFGAKKFNQDLSSWNVSNVTCMVDMFHNAELFNQDLSSWDVSNVECMSCMFFYASSFNQCLNSWNVSRVDDMSFMFLGATAFDQDISSWNVSNVLDMNYMFNQAYAFNQDISSWNVSSVEKMKCMFSEALSFNQNISNWNVANVTDVSNMFESAGSFDQDLSSWVVPLDTDTSDMFLSSAMDPTKFPRQSHQDRMLIFEDDNSQDD